MKILLWLILLVLCWPLALLALILYPLIWLLLIPFRLIGITVTAILDFIKAIITLPARLLKKNIIALLIFPYLLQAHFQNCDGVNSGSIIK